ncbi:MAG: MerR family transcriptional regulator, thiopeptide resistance regulator, partial [Frankiales bacterium]|nr:MerR family transcriptional regulator, thiopeptide resistance regulator [Frankiales bacterium]
DEMFEGFDVRQRQWEADLVDRFGDGVRRHIETSHEATKGWTKQDYVSAQQEWEDFDTRAVTLLRQGLSPRDTPVQDLVAEHFVMVSRHWQPDAESYAGLGQLYVDHPDFKARYDAKDPGLAEFLRDAMASYAAGLG